ncbi:MAG: M42 family metallopeptidase [Phycisphaerales bacterium]
MELLKKLVLTAGVPGREDRVRELIAKHAKPLVDEMRVDAMGNLIAVRKPRPTPGSKKRAGTSSSPASAKPTKVMLAAHMDQIGFIVKHIDDKGYVRVNAAGGFDTRNLFAKHVLVATSGGGGDLPGVMNPAGRPIHIATEEEKKKIPEVGDFIIDMGLTADQAKAKIKIGDMVTLTAPFVEMGYAVASQCLDNRVGCWAVLKTLEQLKQHDCEIHAVWTVQEEVGLRGAGPAAFGVDPDIGVSCDTTLCCDTPGVPDDQRVTEFGKGVCIKIMDGSTIADIKLVEAIEKVAAGKKIPCQRGVLPRGGQDGAMLQRTRSGTRTAVFACPVRNIHTVTEMAHTTDLQSYHQLLAAWLQTL